LITFVITSCGFVTARCYNFDICNTADTWHWGGNCSLAMTPEKDTCNTNSSADIWTNRIYNATACLDGYREGWKHWCKDNATASAFNDLAKQGIIPDFIRNKTRYRTKQIHAIGLHDILAAFP